MKKGIFFAVLAALFLALMGFFVKRTPDVPNQTLVFFRNLFSLIVLLPFLFTKGFSFRTKHPMLHLSRAFFGLFGIYCLFYTLKKLELTHSIMLLNTVPLFIPLIVYFWLNFKIPKKRMLSLLVGFIGILFILKPDVGEVNAASLVGIVGAMSAAIALVSLRLLSKTEDPRLILFSFFSACVLISFVPMVIDWAPIPDLFSWMNIAFVGLSAVLYQYFITSAYKHIPATKAGCVLYICVLFSGILDWLYWGNLPDMWFVIGCLLIIGGGTWTLLDQSEAVPMKGKKQ